MKLTRSILLVLLMLSNSINIWAQEEGGQFETLKYENKGGLMYGINIGLLLANNNPASFYDGTTPNDIGLYLNNINVRDVIQEYVGGYNYYLVELPLEMDYKPATAFGLNLRYQLDWNQAVVADFNYAILNANGLVVLEVDRPNPTGATQAFYEYLDIYGRENRMAMSLGYQYTTSEPGPLGFLMEFGPVLSSVKVEKNAFKVGQREYNILRPEVFNGSQFRNNRQQTVNSFGAYGAIGLNFEFNKFTVEALMRTQMEKIVFDEEVETKRHLNYMPQLRFIYRILKDRS